MVITLITYRALVSITGDHAATEVLILSNGTVNPSGVRSPSRHTGAAAILMEVIPTPLQPHFRRILHVQPCHAANQATEGKKYNARYILPLQLTFYMIQ